MIAKIFEGPETFIIGNGSIQRCNILREFKFVLAKETKVTKKFQVRVGCSSCKMAKF